MRSACAQIQKLAFGLPAMLTESGLSAGAVARATQYNQANAYTVLAALVEAGRVEQIGRCQAAGAW